jgi:MerR family mercuric resistance operon transcriptional regulator
MSHAQSPATRPLRIGAAAAAAGVNVQTLHFYERCGLIRRPARTAAGYRTELNNLRGRGRSVERVAEAARTKLADIDAKIAALTSMRERLRQVVHACKCNGDVGRCEILAGLGD